LHPGPSTSHALQARLRLLPHPPQRCPGRARTPQGVVAFFPSFAYADQAAQRWAATGALAALAARKRVFREPRAAAAVEQTLAQFAAAAAGQATDSRAGECRLGAAVHVRCLSVRRSMSSPTQTRTPW